MKIWKLKIQEQDNQLCALRESGPETWRYVNEMIQGEAKGAFYTFTSHKKKEKIVFQEFGNYFISSCDSLALIFRFLIENKNK
jgi:hypothetical protein